MKAVSDAEKSVADVKKDGSDGMYGNPPKLEVPAKKSIKLFLPIEHICSCKPNSEWVGSGSVVECLT